MLGVEDGADADGAKVAHEQGLLPVLDDMRHKLVRHEDGGDAPEEQHQDTQGDETAVGQPRRLGLVELGPGDDGADVHEAAKVEEHVDA